MHDDGRSMLIVCSLTQRQGVVPGWLVSRSVNPDYDA